MGHETLVSLHGPAINLSLLQTPIFGLFVLTVHWAHELAFGNIFKCLMYHSTLS